MNVFSQVLCCHLPSEASFFPFSFLRFLLHSNHCILPSASIAFISHLFFPLIIFSSSCTLSPEGTSTLTIRKWLHLFPFAIIFCSIYDMHQLWLPVMTHWGETPAQLFVRAAAFFFFFLFSFDYSCALFWLNVMFPHPPRLCRHHPDFWLGNPSTWIRRPSRTGRRRAIWAPWSAASQTRAPCRKMKGWPSPSWMLTPAARAVRQPRSPQTHPPSAAFTMQFQTPTHCISHFVIWPSTTERLLGGNYHPVWYPREKKREKQLFTAIQMKYRVSHGC